MVDSSLDFQRPPKPGFARWLACTISLYGSVMAKRGQGPWKRVQGPWLGYNNSSQIESRPQNDRFTPNGGLVREMGPLFQGNLGDGEILFHLARITPLIWAFKKKTVTNLQGQFMWVISLHL